MEDAATEERVDPALVECWRYDQLVRAGYPPDVACFLSGRDDIDLHLACDLLERHGASLTQALKILM